ncbi:hypothetical protein ACFQ3N_19070 [Virgibacillus byunsanensis]|uniref:DUF4352 domain-containing protein n=1 Tax=Virgibacillus byunsanensis TaxID=570945 RepID=A0ABW3LR11_9BACI
MNVYNAEGTALDKYFGSDEMDTNMFNFDLKEGKNASGTLEYDVAESEFFEVYYEPSFTLKPQRRNNVGNPKF